MRRCNDELARLQEIIGGSIMTDQRIRERDRLLDLWKTAGGEERVKILARLVVIDEEMEVEQSA